MYAQRTVPDTAPEDVSALTVAARKDLYGDAINEELLMKPGQVLTKDLVWVDDKGVDGAASGLAALVGRTLERPAATADRLRPLLRAVDARGRGTGDRGDPGGATVVTSLPLLTILWAVPMLGAALVMLVPATGRALAKWFALLVSVAVLVLAVVLAVGFQPGGDQYQFVESHPWIPSFGTGYILGIDGIALALVVLTAVLVPLLIVAGWNDADDQVGLRGRSTHTYLALTLAVEGMVIMSLISLDVLLFYVFFEAMLIPMYFLIGGFGGEQRSKAAVKFLLYNLFGGLIMLAAVIGLYVVTAGSDAFAGRHIRFPRDRRRGVQR